MEKNCNNCIGQEKASLGWFFGPVGAVILVLIIGCATLVWLMEPRLKEVSMGLWQAVYYGGILFLAWNLIALIALFSSNKVSLLSIWGWKIVSGSFGIAFRFARLVGCHEKVSQAAIQFSNYIFKKKKIKLRANEILILVPHCIQKDTCGLKVTMDTQNCKRCGQCNVGDLAAIEKEMGVEVAIVTGGTLARKRVKEARPKAILAIACERDLISGIRDVFPIPVFGVLNNRPFGPCVNTNVDINEVKAAIHEFLIEEESI